MAVEEENGETSGVVKLRLDYALCCVSSLPDPTNLFSGSATSLVGKYFPEFFAPTETRLLTETLRSAIEEGLGALIVASCVEEDTEAEQQMVATSEARMIDRARAMGVSVGVLSGEDPRV